jgi:hypothetical protein
LERQRVSVSTFFLLRLLLEAVHLSMAADAVKVSDFDQAINFEPELL